MKLDRIDHLVLTVRDVESSVEFYVKVLGMSAVTFGPGRRAVCFGQQKINLHPLQQPIPPHARNPGTGSADLCLISQTSLVDVVAELQQKGVTIEAGPVPRTGALGTIQSVYFRDPDGNLIEVSNYLSEAVDELPGTVLSADHR